MSTFLSVKDRSCEKYSKDYILSKIPQNFYLDNFDHTG